MDGLEDVLQIYIQTYTNIIHHTSCVPQITCVEGDMQIVKRESSLGGIPAAGIKFHVTSALAVQ